MAHPDDELRVNLRLGHMRRQQQRRPRLPRNLRQLRAVGRYVPEPRPGSQPVIVKNWITQAGATEDHLRYLQRGKGVDGRDAPLFTSQGRVVDDRRFAQLASQDPHQFRFAISIPDVGHPFLSPAPYVKTVMQQVERDVGRPLDWVGAIHHDTTHLHAHVVLRGKDRDGNALYIQNDYLSHGLRYRAQEIATWMLGPVQSREREQSRDIDRTPQHVTGLSVEPRRERRERGLGW
jgi:type IV secretory pathway VirD2 relaxase